MNDRKPGFTYLELVCVVLITGIMAGIAVPRFSEAVVQFRADTLARRLAADIAAVQQAARAESTTKTLTIHVATKSYSLDGVINPDRKSAAYVVSIVELVPNATFGAVNLGGDSVLSFNGFGYPDSGGTIQIVVGNRTKSVNIDANSGLVTIS